MTAGVPPRQVRDQAPSSGSAGGEPAKEEIVDVLRQDGDLLVEEAVVHEPVHRELGGTYIVVTHDLGTIKRAADYIIVMWQGQVVEAGPADTVFASRDPFVKQFLQGLTNGPLGMD